MVKAADNKFSKAGIAITANTNAILAYWDNDLVCRFANDAYKDWFGLSPEEMTDRITLQSFLGPLFEKNLPYIKAVLKGQVQVVEHDVITLSGETRNTMATYCPDFEDSEVKGFYVHLTDITHIKTKTSHNSAVNFSSTDHVLKEVEMTLRSCLLTGFPGISKLSRMHFISESKLKRDFKAKFHTGIFSYYRNLQMELADKYITEKKCNKKEVAAMLNFLNPSNFSVCFQKYLKEKKIHKLIEELKKVNDETYKTFITQTPFTIAMFDKEMRFLAASQKWIKDYQLENRRLIGRSIYEIFPNTKLAWKNIHKDCLKGRINKGEDQFPEGENDSPVWLRWDIRPWYDDKKEIGGLLIFTEDITTLKRKESENSKVSEILDKTNEIARIGIWKRDFRTNTGTWSKIIKEILEVPDDFDPNADNALNFYKAGMSRNLAKKALKDSLEKGESFDIEVDMITAKGNLKRVRVIGYPECNNGKCEILSGIFQEIIYQKPNQ